MELNGFINNLEEGEVKREMFEKNKREKKLFIWRWGENFVYMWFRVKF